MHLHEDHTFQQESHLSDGNATSIVSPLWPSLPCILLHMRSIPAKATLGSLLKILGRLPEEIRCLDKGILSTSLLQQMYLLNGQKYANEMDREQLGLIMLSTDKFCYFL